MENYSYLPNSRQDSPSEWTKNVTLGQNLSERACQGVICWHPEKRKDLLGWLQKWKSRISYLPLQGFGGRLSMVGLKC